MSKFLIGAREIGSYFYSIIELDYCSFTIYRYDKNGKQDIEYTPMFNTKKAALIALDELDRSHSEIVTITLKIPKEDYYPTCKILKSKLPKSVEFKDISRESMIKTIDQGYMYISIKDVKRDYDYIINKVKELEDDEYVEKFKEDGIVLYNFYEVGYYVSGGLTEDEIAYREDWGEEYYEELSDDELEYIYLKFISQR